MSNFLNIKSIPHYSASLFEKKHMEFFHIDFSHVDRSGNTTVASLTNFLQETAWQHASRVNIGYFDMLKQNTAFVINKMLIKIKRLPKWNEMISVETWLHPPKKVQTIREFTVRDNNRNLIAAASISYIAINTSTRKLSRAPINIKNCCNSEEFLDEEPGKISTEIPCSESGLHIVKPSDIDMNQHVNNSRYIQWVFDNLPEKWLNTKQKIASVTLNFLNEAHLGDEIKICYTEKESSLILNGINKNEMKCIFWAEICFK